MIPPAAYGVLVVAVFAGGILLADGRRGLADERPDDGRRATRSRLPGQDVTEIKGWMTVGDVATAWGVPLDELLAAFALPADTATVDGAQGPRERPVLRDGAPRLARARGSGAAAAIRPALTGADGPVRTRPGLVRVASRR